MRSTLQDSEGLHLGTWKADSLDATAQVSRSFSSPDHAPAQLSLLALMGWQVQVLLFGSMGFTLQARGPKNKPPVTGETTENFRKLGQDGGLFPVEDRAFNKRM